MVFLGIGNREQKSGEDVVRNRIASPAFFRKKRDRNDVGIMLALRSLPNAREILANTLKLVRLPPVPDQNKWRPVIRMCIFFNADKRKLCVPQGIGFT